VKSHEQSLANKIARSSLKNRFKKAEELARPVQNTVIVAEEVKNLHIENDERAQSIRTAHEYRTNPPSAEELYKFCREVLGYDLMMPQPHDEMCKFCIDLCPDITFKTPGKHYGMLLVPRDTFKSTIVVVGLSLYLLVKNPNLCILIDSYRHDVAKARLKAIKTHIERNKTFRKLFGNWKPEHREDVWSDESINIKPRQDSNSVVVDFSIDTSCVDRPKTGSHPDVILVDDAHNRENASSPTMRAKVFAHIGEFTPMLKPGGTQIVVGTRWAHNDAYGRIIKEDRKNFEETGKYTYKILVRGAYWTNAKGIRQYYFPTRLDEKALEAAKRTPGMTEYLFRSQYFNETIESATNMFPEITDQGQEWEFFKDTIHNQGLVEWRGETYPVAVTLAWDTAGHNPTKESDFHGITVVGCDTLKRLLVLEGFQKKDVPNKIVEIVASQIIHYRPHTVSIEVVGQSGVWITLLTNYLMQNNLYMPYIVENKPPNTMNKFTRIDTVLQPLMANNMLFIGSECFELLDQMEEYPQVDHFDIIDSLAQHWNIIRPATFYDMNDFTDYDALARKKKFRQETEDLRKKFGCFAGTNSSPRPNWSGKRSLGLAK
jgi:phage terminase large subunit-like protein